MLSSAFIGSSRGRSRLRFLFASAALVAFVLLALPAMAKPVANPHGAASASTNKCIVCHSLHKKTKGAPALLKFSGPTAAASLCLSCHNGSVAGASSITTGPLAFGQASGHVLENNSTAPDATNDCASCHTIHGDPSTPAGLKGRSAKQIAKLGDNARCLTCHSTSSAWAGKDYPTTSEPVRNAFGYPIKGTFPGAAAYNDPSNPHSLISSETSGAPKGDCLNCHAPHSGPNTYDDLLYTYRPTSFATLAQDQVSGANAEACLRCHSKEGVSAGSATTDIKSFVSATDASSTAGHRIQTTGATVPAGSPLPCYECHNPHGSARGNRSLISDALGAGLNTQSDTDVRALCFTCHSSSDGQVWDSGVSAYVAVAATQTVSGLRRDGTLLPGQLPKSAEATTNSLRLPAGVDAHSAGDVTSCYKCHGNDYSAGGNNIHNPAGAPVQESSPLEAAASCIDCHTDHQGPSAPSTTEQSHLSDDYCLTCHPGHSPAGTGTVNALSLIPSLTPDASETTSASIPTSKCLVCHGPASSSGYDLQRFSPSNQGGTSTSPYAGHSIITTGTLIPGSALPCTDCHGKHGSASAKRLQVDASIDATTVVRIGDTAGEIDLTTDAGVRNFCFACHTTSDSGKGFDGANLVSIPAATTIEGIDRTSTDARLRLPATISQHAELSTVSCYLCHGNSYKDGGNNVHDPNVNLGSN